MFKFYKEFSSATKTSISIVLLMLILSFYRGGMDVFINGYFQRNFAISIICVLLFIRLNLWVFNYIKSGARLKTYPYLRLTLMLVLTVFDLMLLNFMLHFFINVVVEQNTFDTFLNEEEKNDYILMLGISIVIGIAIIGFYFYKSTQENKLKVQKIIAGTANAKFESLKNQIDPHFLFNSLNVLSALIEENPANAQRFTTSLSKIYRYVLEQKDKELVSVQEELAFAKTYMDLLIMRFESSISFELPENFEQSEAKVVPLALQLLLENCIKHNIVSEQKPLHIKIFEKDNFLVVQNDLQKKAVLQDGQGVGLQNIINRYAILTDRKVMIQESENIFSVHLPILTKQITIMKNTQMNVNSAYFRAKKRVEELKGFYGNITAYCCVIPILIFINLTYSPDFHWFWFSAAGWGFGVLMHAFQVFGYGSSWEEKKLKEILEKDNKTNNWN
jgi:sensor histidine kinase YesM